MKQPFINKKTLTRGGSSYGYGATARGGRDLQQVTIVPSGHHD
ncbi:MAG: hypothetical protein PHH58_13210 [Rhodoferax sp.]|nr:hypothetical protein [Rhodoferax sp.]